LNGMQCVIIKQACRKGRLFQRKNPVPICHLACSFS